ncbi:phytanoyl-CoA dioxygenase family protein [Cohnella silvisoli]|uniref:Phytanoyl-CoA dioxygenase family protein n=1 Tax=Cohnella silvisoli TaxID=2873699 RepID=A0ABV1L541_9BACL|nr:phytanoyl-CoA dioxygenase family protein [Cohnella silvisoli]MCD9026149.1 phytanoyl-CoA dioxygenase family protein [Cohnella silvisoli]
MSEANEPGSYLEFFKNNGYVMVKNAVPRDMCERTVERIFEFMGKSPDDREGWYTPAVGADAFFEDQERGMLPFFHDQTLWDNRTYPKVYEAFAELLGEKKLWVSLDRVNMKPPKRDDHEHLSESFIHWDRDTSNLKFPLRIPSGGLQGVLYLADTASNQGGFQCAPGLFRNLQQYIESQPADRDPRVPNLEGYEIIPITGEAGDLLIWDALLPHGNGENLSNDIRFAQYILMHPSQPDNKENAEARIRAFQRYESTFLPGDPRGWERGSGKGPAVLSQLGRRLLGIESW